MSQCFLGEALVPIVQSLPSHVHVWMMGVAERLLVLLSFILNASVCFLYVKTWRWSPTTKQKWIDEDRLKTIEQYLCKHSLTLTQADFSKENNEDNHHVEESRVQIRIPKSVAMVSVEDGTANVSDNDNNDTATTPSTTTTIKTQEQLQLESRSISDECAICMHPYTIGDKIAWSTNPHCIHCYHVDCLRLWLLPWEARNQRCPCCRQSYCTDELSHDHP